MSQEDRAEREAAEMLPCTKECDEWRGDTIWNQTNTHHPACKAFERIAVAVKLRNLYAEIDRLKSGQHVSDLMERIVQLQEDLERAEADRDAAEERGNQASAERQHAQQLLLEAEQRAKNAEVRGLEWAFNQTETGYYYGETKEAILFIRNVIHAQIDRLRGSGK